MGLLGLFLLAFGRLAYEQWIPMFESLRHTNDEDCATQETWLMVNDSKCTPEI